MNNIILIGFMGCGKSSVGNLLSKKLDFAFLDTDQIIEEECKKSVRDIFAKEGEEHFRSLETKVITDLYGKLNNTVLSVGGGLPIQPGNSELLQKLGQVVYLKSSQETIKIRLQGDATRPLLSGEDSNQKLEELFAFREPFYDKASQITVKTDGRDFDEIIEDIINRIGGKP